MNPNDKFRDSILNWFYERNRTATSQYGKKGSSAKISDVKKGLKESDGLSQQQVMSNLTYLIDKGWINKTEIEKTVKVKGGTVPSTVTWYEISSSGIDKIEGESEFKEGGSFAGINITAQGMNIITLGDGNIVNANFQDLHAALSDLESEVRQSKIGDAEKLNLTADIESLKNQLVKDDPDKNVIGRLWSGVKNVATTAGFVDAVAKIHTLIAGIL